MGFFTKILSKLGLVKENLVPTTTDAPAAQPTAKPTVAPAKPQADLSSAASADAKKVVSHAASERPSYGPPESASKSTPVKPMEMVDVVAKLESLAKGKDLDWKVSIVDLLKLLELDSGYDSRVELAKELGCPEENMTDSARMNVWLHKEVLRKIAENGGNIPQSLLN